MFKKLVIVLSCGLVFSGCSLVPRKAGIEIMSYPTAKVYIDGKEAGMTPYKNSNLKPEETEVKLLVNNQSFLKKIKLQNNINTVIDWEFGKEEKDSGGYILYMERTGDQNRAGLLINVSPNKSAIAIEGDIKGLSPTKIEEIGEGDKQVAISFPAYKTINVFVKALKGYQLVIDAKLAEENTVLNNEVVAEPTKEIGKPKITILPTETGWLRVREEANASSAEVVKVKPKERYELLEEKEGWYKIDLSGGKTGWISAKYAEKLQ